LPGYVGARKLLKYRSKMTGRQERPEGVGNPEEPTPSRTTKGKGKVLLIKGKEKRGDPGRLKKIQKRKR